MADICDDDTKETLINPTNFVSDYYFLLISINSPGYLEYLLDFCHNFISPVIKN